MRLGWSSNLTEAPLSYFQNSGNRASKKSLFYTSICSPSTKKNETIAYDPSLVSW
jgi:hypothetical protein